MDGENLSMHKDDSNDHGIDLSFILVVTDHNRTLKLLYDIHIIIILKVKLHI